MVAPKPDEGNGTTRLREPVAFAPAGPGVLRASDDEIERALVTRTDRGLVDPDAVRRANAARVEAEQVTAQAADDRGTGKTGAPDDAAWAEVATDPGAAQRGSARRAEPAGPTEPAGREDAGTGASEGPTVNGTRAALGAGTPPSPPADPRADVLRWFDQAFTGLRRELREMATGMTRQQAMIAELMDARQADLRLVVVAEGLPDVVQDAVEAAVAESTRELTETLHNALGELRQSVSATESASAAAVAELRRTLEATERSAATALEEARRLQGEAEERELLRARALKAAFTKQLRPLAEAAEQAAEASDRRMDEMMALLDAMADAAGPARSTAKKAPTTRAPAKKAVTKSAATRKTPAKRAVAPGAVPATRPAARKRVLVPAAEPTSLMARRQPLRGLRPLEERG